MFSFGKELYFYSTYLSRFESVNNIWHETLKDVMKCHRQSMTECALFGEM